MLKLNLTVWQRVAAQQLVGNIHGTLARLRTGEKILQALEKAGEVPEGASLTSEERVEVKIGDREAQRLLKELVGGFDGWPMAFMSQVEDLYRQIGLPLPGDEDDGGEVS